MAQYDSYKSSGIEWIGDIPSHWEFRKFNHICRIITDFVASGSFADLRENVQYLSEPDYAMLVRTTDLANPDINEGRVYISKESYTFLSNSNLFGGEVILPNVGSVGSVYMVPQNLYERMSLAPNSIMFKTKYSDRFYFYYFLSFPGNKTLVDLAQSTTLAKFNKTDLRAIRVLFPSPSEQKSIADYLDTECKKIDDLIAKEEKRVSLLEEARQSIIAKAITKGINPDSEMKESGVFWIGATPKSWTVKRLRFTGESKNGLTYTPSDICSEEEGILVLRSSNIQNNKLSFDDNVYVKKYDNRLLVEQGDVIICSRNGSLSLVGKSVYIDSPIKATFGAFMLRYRSCENTEYAYYMVSTAVKMYKALFSTTTVNQLIIGDFKDMVVSIPPLEEQQRIVSYIKDNTSWIENKIAMSKKQIDLLKEYKQSLITEVVTGKRKVC